MSEKEQKKRILNYRPMCLTALALMGGILLGEGLYGVSVYFRFIPLAVLIAVFITLLCLKKVRRFVYIAIFVAIGFLGICASNDVYERNTFEGEFAGVFTARVASEISEINDRYYFDIEDIYLGDQKLKYKGYVYYGDTAAPMDYNAGDIVKLYGKIRSVVHERFDSFHANDVANNYGYIGYVVYVEKLAEDDLHPLERLPHIIKSNFYESMDEDSAAICSALVLGDKGGLDEELKDNISASGLAHVLAVSGLHIATISAALFYVFRKMKLNPKVSVIVVFFLMLFYCFLCDFTASSLRALIMMTVLNFAIAFGRKRDSLSTISFAACAILIFRPTALMEAGFLMSFAAVLGITLFYSRFYHAGMKVVEKVSPKRHFGKYGAKAIALSLSANLTAFPFIAFFFKKVTLLFIVSNIVVLPYLMFIYVFLLIISVFALITTWAGPLVIFKYLLVPFKGYVTIFGGMRFFSIPVTLTVSAVLGILVILFLLSRFVFLKRLTKVFLYAAVSAVTIVASFIELYVDAKSSAREETPKELSVVLEKSDFAPLSTAENDLDFYDIIGSHAIE